MAWWQHISSLILGILVFFLCFTALWFVPLEPVPSRLESNIGPHQDTHVVIAHYAENLSWCSQLIYPYTVISRKGIPSNVPPNRGNEASCYLEYIINNYDNLSQNTVFVHGHRNSWHFRQNMDQYLNEKGIYTTL